MTALARSNKYKGGSSSRAGYSFLGLPDLPIDALQSGWLMLRGLLSGQERVPPSINSCSDTRVAVA